MRTHFVLSGNLGHDPETRFFGQNHDQPVASLSLTFRLFTLQESERKRVSQELQVTKTIFRLRWPGLPL